MTAWATRAILAVSAVIALRQAIWRKPNPEWIVSGIPEQLYVDNVLGHEGKRDLVNRSLCAGIERRGMHSEPDGFHRQRDRSLP